MKKLIGYWNNESIDRYIDPKELSCPYFWDLVKIKYCATKEYFAAYLDDGIVGNSQKGFSECRICGALLGSAERTDNLFVWPDKLSHYVREHNVRLPKEFIEHAVKFKNHEFDDSFWKEWCEKASFFSKI